MILPASVLRGFFDPVADKIIKHVRHMLEVRLIDPDSVLPRAFLQAFAVFDSGRACVGNWG